MRAHGRQLRELEESANSIDFSGLVQSTLSDADDLALKIDSPLAQLPDLNDRHARLMKKTCRLVETSTASIWAHQRFEQACNLIDQWLGDLRAQLEATCGLSGDRHLLQARIDKIQVGLTVGLSVLTNHIHKMLQLTLILVDLLP
ncbi:unnamed protein product [Protopolystoma xenopodis]|uniref:Uncharacterized protein n=1 Tax=Protopolystoma xenopodis TaxID=117903 RepID=A0A3S5FGM6_9PLAT|nr:unnamed protein product [Protopolystoma xenopodis]